MQATILTKKTDNRLIFHICLLFLEGGFFMTDRRIRKTEQALQKAFVQMIMEQELTQISVLELCARADINKSTFYLHYRDIYDLASKIKSRLLDEAYAIIAEYDVLDFTASSPEIWKRILNLFQDNNCLYIPFLTSPSLSSLKPTLEESISDRLIEKAQKDHPEITPDGLKKLRMSITFIISGFLGLMQNLDFIELSDAVFYISTCLNTGF